MIIISNKSDHHTQQHSLYDCLQQMHFVVMFVYLHCSMFVGRNDLNLLPSDQDVQRSTDQRVVSYHLYRVT